MMISIASFCSVLFAFSLFFRNNIDVYCSSLGFVAVFDSLQMGKASSGFLVRKTFNIFLMNELETSILWLYGKTELRLFAVVGVGLPVEINNKFHKLVNV